jgi:pyridoxine 4-dehydrogenase
VQNRLNFTNSNWHNMLTECERYETGFIPYRPLRAWSDPAHQQVLTAAASRHSANTSQIALSWLLAVSPVTLPIPGTATPAHLEDNMAAAALQLEPDEIHAITAAASSATQRPTQSTWHQHPRSTGAVMGLRRAGREHQASAG